MSENVFDIILESSNDSAQSDDSKNISSINSQEIHALSTPSMFWRPNYTAQSAWIEHVPFAFWLIENLRPSSIVELGTHYGVSYFAFCQAVQRLGLNTHCFAVDTWKGDEHSGTYGENVFQHVNQHNDFLYSDFSRLVRSTFDEALSHFDNGTIDLLHIDGLHTFDAVAHDFNSWLPKLSENAVVIMHDTNVRERGFGVFKLFSQLKGMYPSFEFFHGHGLGVLGVGKNQPPALTRLYGTDRNENVHRSICEIFGRLGRACADAKLLIQIEEKSKNLTQDIEKQKKQIDELKSQLDKGKSDLNIKSKELLEINSQLSNSIEKNALERGQLVEKIIHLKENKDKLESEISIIKETVLKYGEELRIKESTIYQEKGEKNSFQKELEFLKFKTASIEKDFNLLQEKNNALTIDISIKKNEVQNALAAQVQLAKEKAELQNEIVNLKNEIKTISNTTNEYNKNLGINEKQIKELTEEKSLLNQSLNIAKDELHAIENDINSTKDALDAAVDKLNTTQNELSTVKDKLNTTQNELSTAKDGMNAANNELKTTQDELNTVKDKLNTTQNELSTAKDGMNSAKNELKTIKDELNSTKEALKNAASATTTKNLKYIELESKLKDVSVKNSTLESANAKLSKSIDDRFKEIANLTQIVNEKETALKAADNFSAQKDKKITDLHQLLKKKEDEATQFKQIIKDTSNELEHRLNLISQLSETIALRDATINEFSGELEHRLNLISHLSETIALRDATINEFSGELEHRLNLINQLSETIALKDATINEFSGELDHRLNLINQLSETVAVRDTTINEFSGELDHRLNLINQLSETVTLRDTAINEFSDELDHRLDLITQLSETIALRDATIKEFGGELEQITQKCQEKNIIINKLENDIADMHRSTSWKITAPLRSTKGLINPKS